MESAQCSHLLPQIQTQQNFDSMHDQLLNHFVAEQALPETYAGDARQWFLPLLGELTEKCRQKRARHNEPLLLGINGAQGTGKSTLAALLCKLLRADDLIVAELSIDDFYLSKAKRQELAQEVHPLFASRGVPGTHDTALLKETLAALRKATKSDQISLPRFDKAQDDCCPESLWPTLRGPVDIIILEGWFIGLQPQSAELLQAPVNALESEEDPDSRWRVRVNDALGGDFQDVFAGLDDLIMLRAPSFDQVYEWRQVQEDKLRQRSAGNAPGLMDSNELRRFIQHFERLTRHCLATLPVRADRVYELDPLHRVVSCHPSLQA